MGQVLFSGGGGNGVYSEDCTATANDILKGKNALFNGSDDDIGVGTLELTGTAVDNQVIAGKTYYSTDAHTKRTGTIQSQPGWTPIPSTIQQTLNCKGKYMTENVVIPGFVMPPADAIKKGATVSIYDHSVTGTWEGYTPTTTYFWNSGNVGGVVGKGQLGFGSLGQVYSNDSSQVSNTLTTPSMIDLRRYTHVFVDIAKSSVFSSASVEIYRIDSSGNSRLLCTFYTTSGSYTRMSYQYDASRQGKLKLVFTQQGTGILTWGVQAV